jgi:hypothetical protein
LKVVCSYQYHHHTPRRPKTLFIVKASMQQMPENSDHYLVKATYIRKSIFGMPEMTKQSATDAITEK